MQSAIGAGLLFRHSLELLILDTRVLAEMVGCVDDVVQALREYHQEAQWIERQRLREADRLVSTTADATLPEV